MFPAMETPLPPAPAQPPPSGRAAPGRKWAVAILLSLIVLLTATGALRKSPTFDEPRFLGLGLYLARNMQWDIDDAIAHPPLTYYMNSIPLAFLDIPDSVWSIPNAIHRGRAIIRLYPDDMAIRLARIPTILVSLLLAVYVYRWAKDLFGEKGGLFALALYAFNPTVLAFSGIINADIPITAFIFITLYHWWRYFRTGRMSQALLAGLFFGLALLSKYTALMLLPLLAFSLLAHRLFRPRSAGAGGTAQPAYAIRPLKALVAVLAVAFLVAWAGYGFQRGTVVSPGHPSRLLDSALGSHERLRRIAYAAAERIPVPMTPFLKGTAVQFHMSRYWQRLHPVGGINFLMGEYSDRGWPHYYLVAFVLKTPLGTLLALVSAILLARRLRSPSARDECHVAIPPLFFLFYFSAATTIQVGIRYILPAFPFLFVFASRIALPEPRHPAKWPRAVAALAAALTAASTLWNHPTQLAYFNELAGGPDKGYRYLVDSNLDWGQELGALKRHMVEHGIRKVHLSYFGTAEPEYYGIDYDYLPSSSVEAGWSFLDKSSPRDGPVELPEGIVAISATELQGVYFADKNTYGRLRSMKPLSVLGGSIFLYRIDRANIGLDSNGGSSNRMERDVP